jgi:hypothetical protein
MIAKAVKGSGFRGAAEYDIEKEGGRIIDTNMAGENPRELAKEFSEIRKLRPNLSKAVLHVSLSAAPGEKLTDAQWRDIGKRYMDGMGLEKNQFVTTRHTDTEHEHIHILANRIRFDGSVTSDSQDYKRQEVIMRELERDYGLQRVAPSREAQRKAPTKGEIERSIRIDQPSAKQQLQQLCDSAAKNCPSFTRYQERLEAADVELIPVVQLEGAKLSGLSYRLGGITMKGSDLGKGYSAAGLAKRGVTYEQDRDFAAVCRSIERDTARAVGEPNLSHEVVQIPGREEADHGQRLADAIAREEAPKPTETDLAAQIQAMAAFLKVWRATEKEVIAGMEKEAAKLDAIQKALDAKTAKAWQVFHDIKPPGLFSLSSTKRLYEEARANATSCEQAATAARKISEDVENYGGINFEAAVKNDALKQLERDRPDLLEQINQARKNPRLVELARRANLASLPSKVPRQTPIPGRGPRV